MPRITVTGRPELVPEAGDELVSARRTLEERLLRHLELAGAAPLAFEGLRELVDHGGGDLGGDDAATHRRLMDRVQDLVAVGVLQDVAARAGHQHVAHRSLVLRAGERDDPDVGVVSP